MREYPSMANSKKFQKSIALLSKNLMDQISELSGLRRKGSIYLVLELKHVVEIPKVVYRGTIDQDFIKRVREYDFNLHEGVICKGIKTAGNFSGGVLLCKIKTHVYLEKLQARYGNDWIKYAE